MRFFCNLLRGVSQPLHVVCYHKDKDEIMDAKPEEFDLLLEVTNAYNYALANGINPKDKATWDSTYKDRMRKLAGIITEGL